jgi:NAD+ synthetase
MSFELNSSPNVDDGDDRLKNWKIRNGNMKARLRMIYLYNLAADNRGMVLSTDNYTEYMLGFWTLHGDVGDYGMIQELWKTEVYDMAEWIMENEPLSREAKEGIRLTLEADATDGLGITNTSLNQILPDWTRNSREGYKEVDRILQKWQNASEVTMENFKIIDDLRDHPVIQRHLKSAYKRNNPYNLKRNLIIE